MVCFKLVVVENRQGRAVESYFYSSWLKVDILNSLSVSVAVQPRTGSTSTSHL